VGTTATVRATSKEDTGKYGEAEITVIIPTSGTGAPAGITLKAQTGTADEEPVLNGGTLTLEPGSALTTTVKAALSGAQPGYDQFMWNFTAPASITTKGVTSGAVTAPNKGLAITPGNVFTQMTVTVENCKTDGDLGDLTATFTVIVGPPGSKKVTAVIIDDENPAKTAFPSFTLQQGGTKQLYALVTPSDAFNQEVVWASNRSDIASVDAFTGLVTAGNKGGTAKITAIAGGIPSDPCVVTVPDSDGSGSVDIQFWTNKADSTLVKNISAQTLSRTGSNGVPTQAVIQGDGSNY
jgi:hypothetical protein